MNMILIDVPMRRQIIPGDFIYKKSTTKVFIFLEYKDGKVLYRSLDDSIYMNVMTGRPEDFFLMAVEVRENPMELLI